MQIKQRVHSKLGRSNYVLLVGLLLLSLVGNVILPSQKAEAAVPLNFTLLGTHPQAAAQATSDGKRINKLQVFNGKLIAAYGDYQNNTGPIDINPFDIAGGSFDGSALSVPTESLGNWKVINGKLYSTTIDATCSGSCPSGFGSTSEFSAVLGVEVVASVNNPTDADTSGNLAQTGQNTRASLLFGAALITSTAATMIAKRKYVYKARP